MPPRVIYLDHVARLSGGEIALLRTLEALGDRVEALVLLGEDGPLVPEMEAAGIPVEVLTMDTPTRDLRKGSVRPGGVGAQAIVGAAGYTWQIARRLRELKPDLVHTNSLKSALYGGVAGRLAGVPVIWHVRDRIATDYLPPSAVRLVRTASRVLPTAIIANSRTTLDTLPGRAGAVVSNAVVPDSVPSETTPSDATDRPFRVCIVGRLAPWKGQDLFLRAFAEAFPADREVEACLLGSAMFGEDDYAKSLGSLAAQLGIADRVVMRGFRRDVWAELARVDLLVHCSLTPEPFGQVVLEGLAAGVPVIAAAAGGPSEIITDGVDGFLTPPGDVHSLARAMKRLRDDPSLRVRLSEAGRATASRYSPENTATQVLAVYDRVLSSHRRSR